MGIGAKDRIDQALVSRYCNVQTNIYEPEKALPADRMWNIMNQVSNYNRLMMDVKVVKKHVNGLAQPKKVSAQ